MAGKIVKKIPASENGPGLLCKTKTGDEYHVTQCLERRRFTLWHKADAGYEQIAVAKFPIDLEDKIPWND